MKKIDNPSEYEVVVLDADGTASGVYLGTIANHVPAKLTWRVDGDREVLTLAEIATQLDGCLTVVFIESPMRGKILQYGNYGDSWHEIGETCGYERGGNNEIQRCKRKQNRNSSPLQNGRV